MTEAASLRRDVIVVGGGPAGLTAALQLAGGSLSVTVVDEQPELGGQYYRRPAPLTTGHDHRPEGGRLVDAVRSAGVQCLTDTLLWGVDDDGETLLTWGHQDGVRRLTGRFVVVATGAYERVFPFRGWDLPGVTTVGFAQHLAADRIPVGERVLLAGSGPFLLPVACSLLDVGIDVVGIAEAGTPYNPRAASGRAARFPARMAELARYASVLARRHVPIWQGRVVAAAESATGPAVREGRVARVRLAATSQPLKVIATVAADALCVGYGFRPQTELLRLLGCATAVDPWSGDLLPVTDMSGRTSRHQVYAIGEVARIGGVHAARHRAQLAVRAILAAEHRSMPLGTRRRSTRAWRRDEAFRQLVEDLYPPPSRLGRALMADADDDLVVCRCEQSTSGAVRAAAEMVGRDPSAVKAATRAGMGVCQGRECGAALSALIGAEGTPTTSQPPIRPIPLAALTVGR